MRVNSIGNKDGKNERGKKKMKEGRKRKTKRTVFWDEKNERKLNGKE